MREQEASDKKEFQIWFTNDFWDTQEVHTQSPIIYMINHEFSIFNIIFVTKGKYIPRAILVDLEPGCLDSIRFDIHFSSFLSSLLSADIHFQRQDYHFVTLYH